MRCPHHCWEKPKGQPDWSPPSPAFLFPRAAALCPAYSGMDGKGHVGAGQRLRQATKTQLIVFRQTRTPQFTEQPGWQAGGPPAPPLPLALHGLQPLTADLFLPLQENQGFESSQGWLRGSATGPTLIRGFQLQKSQRRDTPAPVPVPRLTDSGWRGCWVRTWDRTTAPRRGRRFLRRRYGRNRSDDVSWAGHVFAVWVLSSLL